jgi:hypothetical protein
VSDKKLRSCLDPELPGTGLQTEGDEGLGLFYPGNKHQSETSRDGENIKRSEKVPILDVMKEDQQPTE